MSKGRPKTDVWKHFVEVKEDNAIRARCKNCGHMVNNAERMKAHWKTRIDDDAPSGASERKIPRLSRTTLSSFASTSSIKPEQSDMLITKFVVGSNSPFNVVENDHFRDMIQTLRPGTKIPSRQSCWPAS